jgi:hypothetical protein
MDIQTPTAFFLHQIFTISHRKCVPLKSDDKKLHEVLLLSLFSKINDERFMCLRCSASSASLVSCERPPEGEQMNDREKHGPQNGSAKARCTIRKRRVYKLPLAFRLLLLTPSPIPQISKTLFVKVYGVLLPALYSKVANIASHGLEGFRKFGCTCYSASSERKLLLHKLMCIVLCC